MSIATPETKKSDFADLEFDYLYSCWEAAVENNDFNLVRKLFRELSVRPEWSAYNANQAQMA